MEITLEKIEMKKGEINRVDADDIIKKQMITISELYTIGRCRYQEVIAEIQDLLKKEDVFCKIKIDGKYFVTSYAGGTHTGYIIGNAKWSTKMNPSKNDGYLVAVRNKLDGPLIWTGKGRVNFDKGSLYADSVRDFI